MILCLFKRSINSIHSHEWLGSKKSPGTNAFPLENSIRLSAHIFLNTTALGHCSLNQSLWRVSKLRYANNRCKRFTGSTEHTAALRFRTTDNKKVHTRKQHFWFFGTIFPVVVARTTLVAGYCDRFPPSASRLFVQLSIANRKLPPKTTTNDNLIPTTTSGLCVLIEPCSSGPIKIVYL